MRNSDDGKKRQRKMIDSKSVIIIKRQRMTNKDKMNIGLNQQIACRYYLKQPTYSGNFPNLLLYFIHIFLCLYLYLFVLPLLLPPSALQYNYFQKYFNMNPIYSDIDCVFQGFGGKGRIYVSGIYAASNSPLLKRVDLKIKSVISIAESGFLVNKSDEIVNYMYIPAEDHEFYDIKQHFDETFQFIQKSRKQANVLVHCMAGISRSATIVIAYLIKKYEYSVPAVLTLLQRKRCKINPNSGFIKQLEDYCQEMGIKDISNKEKKHKRAYSSFPVKKSESAKIKEKEKKESENKQITVEKPSTKINENEEKVLQIGEIDKKINNLREKIMVMGKLRYKSNKNKKGTGQSWLELNIEEKRRCLEGVRKRKGCESQMGYYDCK